MMERHQKVNIKGVVCGLSAVVLSLTTLNVSAADNLELVKNGETNVVLVLPDKPAPDEKLAADELSGYFEKISGVKSRL